MNGERSDFKLQQFAPGDPGATPTSNTIPKSESPARDKVVSSIAQGQVSGSIQNPNGGLLSAAIGGGYGAKSTDMNSDSILSKRIFGTPYQFMDTTDYRPAAQGGNIGDGELGATFMEMMAEAPILSIIPGKANFLPDLTDDQKKEFVDR